MPLTQKKILGFQLAIEDRLRKFKNQLDRELKKELVDLLQEFLPQMILESPTTQSILDDALHGELGLEKPDDKIDRLINFLVRNANIKTDSGISRSTRVLFGKQLTGLDFSYKYFIDFDDLTSQPFARQRWTRLKIGKRGGKRWITIQPPLPWLSWLIFRGKEVINPEYEATDGDIQRSRSGTGIVMKRGGTWSVPAPHDGTKDNNFITRAFKTKKAFFERQLVRVYRQAIKTAAAKVKNK